MTPTAASLANSGDLVALPKTPHRSANFLWADFLRRRIKRKLIDNDFSSAMKRALHLAKGTDGGYLPGWCGPIVEG